MSASEIDAAIEDINRVIAAAPEGQSVDLIQLQEVIRLHSVLQSPAYTHPTIEEFGSLLDNYIGNGLQSGEVVALPFLSALTDLCQTILIIFPHDRYPDQWRSAAYLNLGILLHCERGKRYPFRIGCSFYQGTIG